MAGVLERINARVAKMGAASRDTTLNVDEWSALFQFGGVAYPLIQTTMGNVKEERIAGTTIAAHHGNSAVFSLVQARMQAFSQVRFQWTRFAGSQPGDLFGTQELNVLEHPWPNGNTANLLARMELDNQIAGNSYIVRPRTDRLARLRPDLVTIVLGSKLDPDFPMDAEDVEIAGYAYWPRSGKAKFFLPEEICHYASQPDPNFQFLGMSWLTPCIREVQADSLTVEHKARFFQNAATPNLAIKFDPQIGLDMVKQFKALMEEEHRGAFNAYKTLYLGGGADPVTVGKDFQQLEFSATQGKGESRLAAAAGVPPSWVGFSEGLQGSSLNAGNFNSARRRFSDGTMYHLWMTAAGALESILNVPPGASLWFDNRVPFMREDAADLATIQSSKASTITQLVREGFEPESVVESVVNNDESLLKHTGLLSVQLQPPGTSFSEPGTAGAGAGPPASSPAKPAKPAKPAQKPPARSAADIAELIETLESSAERARVLAAHLRKHYPELETGTPALTQKSPATATVSHNGNQPNGGTG